MRERERADDLLRMHRLARTGGTAELLRWLAGRAGGWAGLVGPDGTVLHAAARTARAVVPDIAGLVAEGASALTERGAQAYSLDTGAHTALLFPLSADDRAAPVLAVVTPRPVAAGLATLLADVVLPLSVCRQAEPARFSRWFCPGSAPVLPRLWPVLVGPLGLPSLLRRGDLTQKCMIVQPSSRPSTPAALSGDVVACAINDLEVGAWLNP